MIFKTFWRRKNISQDKKTVFESSSDAFKYRYELETRFADFDAMGHINNAIYFTYLEIGRTKYWKQVINWDWKKSAVVIKHASINYIKPILIGDKISVYVRTSRLGNTSFDLEYLVVKTEQGLEIECANAKTTCITIDYENRQPITVPTHERHKMITFEQLQ